MSFSSELKDSIIDAQYKKPCCRKALLLGVLFSRAVNNGNTIEVSIVKEHIDFVCKLVREFYGKDIDISRSPIGGRRYLLTFCADPAAEYLSKIEEDGELFSHKCDNCQSSFLRGVFLASARVSDPAKNYAMHFSLGGRSERFADYLRELDMEPKIYSRGSERTVYFKDGAMTESFYAYALMNKAMFTLFDLKAQRELKQIVVSRSVCDTNNINRSTAVAGRQVRVIAALESMNLLSSLPDELENTARLRLENPDLTLARLAQIAVPSISKPGLSHRLKKIMEIAKQLLPKEIYDNADKEVDLPNRGNTTDTDTQ